MDSATDTKADLERATREITEFHEFFVGWISGELSNDPELYRARFESHLGESFVMVQPGGARTPRGPLVAGMATIHGTNPDFRIAISDVVVEQRIGDVLIATYTEWQKNAKASKPANNGRRASVIFQDDGEALRWAHMHETWLPADEMAAGDYSF